MLLCKNEATLTISISGEEKHEIKLQALKERKSVKEYLLVLHKKNVELQEGKENE